MTSWPDATFAVRATRARPPALASDGPRRRTYGAALAQFDELLSAARASGPASRPVALFYALSQAGRAVAAAHAADAWRLYGHGLEAPDLDLDDPLSVRIRRPQHRPSKNPERIDSFAGTAQATGSPLIAQPVTLGEAWAALPGAGDLLPQARWPRALLLIPDEPGSSKLFAWGRLSATVVGFDELTAEGVRQQLARYPAATEAHNEAPPGIPLLSAPTTAGPGVRLYWPTAALDLHGQKHMLDHIAPVDALTGAHWLRPYVGESALSDLMSWWLVLFALSMLARYEPDRWTAALDYDTSELAAALGALLDLGLATVPALVLAALAPPGTEG